MCSRTKDWAYLAINSNSKTSSEVSCKPSLYVAPAISMAGLLWLSPCLPAIAKPVTDLEAVTCLDYMV